MRETYFEAKIDELLAYPEHYFGEPPSERWLSLCSSLSNYQAPSQTFAIDQNRKWELVSALQKAIRRADKATVLKLISAFAHMPQEHGYLWRRMCVIACEDVGPADNTLAKFVVACATLFAPKRTREESYRLWCFLVEQMCDLPARSRIYCRYGTLDPAIAKSELPRLDASDAGIIDSIVEQKRRVMLEFSRFVPGLSRGRQTKTSTERRMSRWITTKPCSRRGIVLGSD